MREAPTPDVDAARARLDEAVRELVADPDSRPGAAEVRRTALDAARLDPASIVEALRAAEPYLLRDHVAAAVVDAMTDAVSAAYEVPVEARIEIFERGLAIRSGPKFLTTTGYDDRLAQLHSHAAQAYHECAFEQHAHHVEGLRHHRARGVLHAAIASALRAEDAYLRTLPVTDVGPARTALPPTPGVGR